MSGMRRNHRIARD
jgi:CheY-like chemotaxis protein